MVSSMKNAQMNAVRTIVAGLLCLLSLSSSAYLLRLTGVTTEWSLVLPNARVEDVNIAVVETGAAALLCYESRYGMPGFLLNIR